MIKNLINLFFPPVCEACDNALQDNESSICITCRHELPVTNFHFDNCENVKKVLYGRVQLENATALLYFSKKGKVQQILHNLKYKGHEHISELLGSWLGAELQSLEAYQQLDVVIPVPLYKTRLKKRGYNQVTGFGRAIANALNIEYNDTVLQRIKSTQTKVFKGRSTRYEDNSVFDISPNSSLNGKHILLVDDIITTGATVEACSKQLLKIPNIKLSLATMAIAN